jgi:hypothetical protein
VYPVGVVCVGGVEEVLLPVVQYTTIISFACIAAGKVTEEDVPALLSTLKIAELTKKMSIVNGAGTGAGPLMVIPGPIVTPDIENETGNRHTIKIAPCEPAAPLLAEPAVETRPPAPPPPYNP